MDYLGFDYFMVYSFANAFAFEGQDVPAYGLAIHNRKLFFAPWYTGNVVAIDIDDPTRIQKIYSGVNAKPWAMAVLFKPWLKIFI